jgi:hypothetical protein
LDAWRLDIFWEPPRDDFFEHFSRRLSIIKTVLADPANIDFSWILNNITGGNGSLLK